MFYTKDENAVFSGRGQNETFVGKKKVYEVVLLFLLASQPAIICSKLTRETLEQSVKCVQS